MTVAFIVAVEVEMQIGLLIILVVINLVYSAAMAYAISVGILDWEYIFGLMLGCGVGGFFTGLIYERSTK